MKNRRKLKKDSKIAAFRIWPMYIESHIHTIWVKVSISMTDFNLHLKGADKISDFWKCLIRMSEKGSVLRPYKANLVFTAEM